MEILRISQAADDLASRMNGEPKIALSARTPTLQAQRIAMALANWLTRDAYTLRAIARRTR